MLFLFYQAYLVISVKAALHLTNVQRNKKKSIVPTLGTTVSNKKIQQEDKTIKTEFFAKAVHQQINAGKKEIILWNAAKMAFAIRVIKTFVYIFVNMVRVCVSRSVCVWFRGLDVPF